MVEVLWARLINKQPWIQGQLLCQQRSTDCKELLQRRQSPSKWKRTRFAIVSVSMMPGPLTWIVKHVKAFREKFETQQHPQQRTGSGGNSALSPASYQKRKKLAGNFLFVSTVGNGFLISFYTLFQLGDMPLLTFGFVIVVFFPLTKRCLKSPPKLFEPCPRHKAKC